MELSRNLISYTNQDMKTILQNIEETRQVVMPEYTDRSDTDFGNFLLKYVAMVADVISWKTDYNINEAIPASAVTMRAMYKHCKWKGYRPRSNRAATTKFEITIMNNGQIITFPKGFKMTMEAKVAGDYLKYEFDHSVTFTPPEDAKPGDLFTLQVTGTQGESVSETIGYATEEEDQEYYIRMSPYIEGSISVEAYNPVTMKSIFFTENENKTFVGTSPTDKVIVLEAVDLNLIKVKFGDGYNGRMPDIGCQLIAHYRIGGGVVGNRPIGVINAPLDNVPSNVVSIKNIEESTGGVDSESVEEIKYAIEKNRDKIIYSLMQKVDFENFLANRSDTIERFMVCQDILEPARLFRPIAIYIKPYRNQFFSQEYKDELLAEMNRIRLVDDWINIYDCTFTKFKIHINVTADPLYVATGIASAIKYAINDYFDNMPIGERDGTVVMYMDDVRNVVRGVEGVSRFISNSVFCDKDLEVPVIEDRVLKVGEILYFEDIEQDIQVDFV